MKLRRKLLAVLIAAAMTAGMLGGCSSNEETASDDDASTTTTAGSADVTENDGGDTNTSSNDTPLVIAMSAEFSQKFTPFFADSVNDQEVQDLVDLILIGTDRAGGVVYKGIEGETRSYNGTDYTYYGPADITVTIDENTGETKYNFKLRDDLKFSDGKPVTADDIIFSLYVYCDNSFDGGATIGTLPIKGVQNYKTQTTDEVYEKYAAIVEAAIEAGPGFEGESDIFTAEQYANYYECVEAAWEAAVQNIINYVNANYVIDDYTQAYFGGRTADEVKASEGLQVAYAMAMWGFGEETEDGVFVGAATGTEWDLTSTFPTLDDYCLETFVDYGGSLADFSAVELVDPDAEDPVGDAATNFINTFGSTDEAMGGEGVKSIAGIQKLGDYEVEVTLTKFDAAAIYRMSIPVAPLHYYGDESMYDPDNGMYGFTRGDVSGVHAKDTKPLGGGAYKFVKFENKVVYLEANENYYLGEPKIKSVQMKESNDSDVIPGIVSGAADIGTPSVNLNRLEEIKSSNSNGETQGEILHLNPVYYRGYGYIGISGKNVSVGGEPDSDASKNLRKGIATVMSVYRDLTVTSFYGDTASVINYPISNTSWAAPQKTDAGYREAYSVDVNGNDIFTSDMDADARYEAAKKAALGFFEAAGYTLNEDKTAVTQAPDGARLEYEIYVGGSGEQDHPSFALLTASQATFAEIGIKLEINDLSDTNIMWDSLKAETQDLWCAAWQATPDPDMHQTYHSSNRAGMGGTNSNYYGINDAALDDYIIKARESADDAYRKELYKDCLDIIMDWAVEIPVYQRNENYLFSAERINIDTLTPDITTYWSWAREIQTLEMK